jgi:serine phosphatase RsbU (regulator of sigma subunit)
MSSPGPLYVSFAAGDRPTERFDPVDESHPLTVGRPSSSGPSPTITLQDSSVSRLHVEIAVRDGRWHARSLGKAGTILDGHFMVPEQWKEIGHGATMGIAAFRLRLGIGSESVPNLQTVEFADAPASSRPEAIGRQRLESAQVRLSALLAAARRIGTCRDEKAVAEAVVDILCESGDFDRAVLVRHARENERDVWEPVALWGSDERVRNLPLSRTVLQEALHTKGTVRLDMEAGAGSLAGAQSIVASGATAIVCAPLPRGDTPSSFLYADTRAGGSMGESAIPFVDMVAQLAALAEDQFARLKLEEEMGVARSIQQGSFPSALPQVAGYEIAARSTPAEHCGGDAFDCIGLVGSGIAEDGGAAERALLMIGDATGHGVGPALSSMQARGMTRLGARLGQSLLDIVREVNAQLCQDLPPGRFVTAWYGLLDPASHSVESFSAGQGPIYVYRHAEDRFEFIDSDAMPFGVASQGFMPDAGQQVRIELKPNDILLVITDGYYEAMNPAGEQWGEAAVQQLIQSLRDRPCAEILEALDRGSLAFSKASSTQDDRTAILVRRLA